VLLAALALGPLATPLAAETLPAWRERYLATLKHCRGASPLECRDSLAALRLVLPGHPTVVVALARAAMRGADHAGALAALETYAAMGLTAEVAQDSLFAPLAADSAFARITARLAGNAAPLARATLLHRFADTALLTEDVAWDASHHRWLVSSIHQRRIVSVDSLGHETDFLAPGTPRPWGVFALGVDRARHRLWASMAATPESDSLADADKGRTALACYDLDRGTLVHRWELNVAGESHVLGDLTLGPRGEVYITDSIGGGVYRAVAGKDSLQTLLAPGSFSSPQSPVLAPGGKRLLIPDYSRGIAALDLAKHTVRWLAQPADLAAAGIDGLTLWNGQLIAIQNGVEPHRVLALALDAKFERITSWRVLEQASPSLGEPNHGTLIGNEFVLIGNSGWERVGDDGKLGADAATLAPALLRLKLP
jgi:hypothetical protein